MTGALSAELLKLRKRPATWVVLAILVVFVLLFGYVLLWLLATNAPEEAFSGGPPPAELLETLHPDNLTAYAASNVTGVGGALVLVLGALIAGSEYGWGTVRTIAVVRPGRATIALAKVVAVTAAAAVLSLVGFAAAGAGAAMVAAAEGLSGWPDAWEVVRALGASWLVLTAWGQLGLGLGFLTRNTGVAIGIGLVYLLVLESLATLLPDTVEAVRTARDALLGVNANALVARFGEVGADLGAGTGSAAIDPVQAALVVSAYVVAFAAVSAITFARRELV